MDNNTLFKMQNEFKNNFSERQDTQKSFKNVNDLTAFARENMAQTKDRLKRQEGFVENKIFAGELEEQAEAEDFDFTHNYVYQDAEESVEALNKSVSRKIGKFREASIEEQGLLEKDEPLGISINRPPKTAGWKKRRSENSLLDSYRKFNPRADISTVREYKTLEKYNELRSRFIETDENDQFKDQMFREAEGRLSWMNKPNEFINENEQKNEQREKYFLRHGIMPFLKTYKKGWFGRKYTLDGKRIKEKKGEMTYDEYNANFVRIMSLDTRFEKDDKNRNDKKILENRKIKGEFIMGLARELMDQKITENMLTDEYLAEHVGEMQQYVDKLNAFQVIIQENRWVFNTSGDKTKVVDDEYLNSLMENRILQVSDRLNVFMDEHYAAHGMYRMGKFTFKKLGMMKEGDGPTLRSANRMTREKRKLIRDNQGNDKKNMLTAAEELQDFQKEIENNSEYRYEQILNTARPIDVVGLDGELNDEKERDEYLSKSKELNDNLDRNIRRASTGLKEAYDDATQFADRILDEIISDTLKGYSGKIRKETDESVLGIKTFIEGCPEMSLIFGPEIEQLYTKLYTSKRLFAELRARKEAIKEELKKDKDRNESRFSYKTKNIYGQVLNDYFSEDIKKHAREAGRIIDRKLEVLEENNSVIEKAIRFFLEDPGKTTYTGDDLKQIQGYLEKEGLGRMFKITKIDNYKELMDEVILEKDLSMREKDSGAPEYDDIKKADEMTAGERALQIYNVRRRDKARLNLKQWMESAKDNYTKEQAEHASMVPFAADFDVTQVDHKGEIPVNDEKTVEKVYHQHQMELAAKRLKENRARYRELSNYEAMLKRYRIVFPLVKDMEIDSWKVFKYMAETRAKVDFLAAHSEVNEALLKIRQNPSYPYFDMSRIAGLPKDELTDLIAKLEAKEEKLNHDLDTLDKEHSRASDIIKLQDKLDGTKDIILMTKEYLKIRQFENKYPVSSKEAIDNQARKYELDLRIEDARPFFRLADERYVELQDIYKENKEVLSSSAHWSGKFNRRIKAKEVVKDSEMEETLSNRCTELLDIDVKDTIERLSNLSDENKRISAADVVELGKRWGVIDSISRLFNKINNPDEQTVNEADKRLIAIMKQPKQKKLRDGVLKKLPLLIPLRDAIKDYLASYRLKPNGTDTADNWGEESTLTEEQIEDARFKYRQSSKNHLEKCEKLSKDYEPDVVEGKLKSAKDRVFEELLKKGEKLSILELDKWKKKIEGIVKFSDMFDSISEREYWHKLAAMQILDNWPYEFEQFYALRIKNDTYRAFSVQVKTLLGKEGANVLNEEQIKRSADLSQFVSEQESQTYFVLNENDTKELDRALEANKYDKKAFKHIFDTVDVNSSGMPLGITEVNKRNDNALLAKNARAYFAMKPEEKSDAMKSESRNSALSPEEKEKRAHNREVFKDFARNLQDRIIMPLVNDKHLTDMNESMLQEEYIGEHFKELYGLSQKIACLETIYRNNKEYFTDEGLLSGINDYDRVKKIIDENFGIRNNRMIVRFKQLIDAYARKNFVDESGSFDIGLSAEDLVLSEDKKQNKEDVGKRNEKVREAVRKRNAEYEKRYSDVDAELSRNKIAKNTEEAASRDDVIYSVKITSTDDKLFAAGFHVSDFKLLVQNKALMKDIAERDEAKKIYFDAIKVRDKFADDIKMLEQKGEKVSDQLKFDYKRAKEKVEEYYESWYQKLQKVAGHNDMAEDFYKIYQNCHDENGKLILKQEGKDGSRINRMGEYIRFQVYVGADMSGFFDNFIEMYEKNGEKILDEKFIAGQMKQDNWGQFYRDIKRFSVYSAIMQKEAETRDKEGKVKGFFTNLFSINNPVVSTLKSETADFERSLKEAKKSESYLNNQYSMQMKKFTDLVKGSMSETDQKKKEKMDQDIIKLQSDLSLLQNQIDIVTAKIPTLEKQIEDYKAAAHNMQKLSEKDQKFVKKYQEYVRQVELVLTRYGVRDDGSLFASGLDDDNMDLAHTNAYKAQEAIEASKNENSK